MLLINIFTGRLTTKDAALMVTTCTRDWENTDGRCAYI